MSETSNDHFTSIGPKLVDKIHCNENSCPHLDYMKCYEGGNSFHFKETNSTKLCQLKAIGLDKISARLLRLCSDLIAESLCVIFNDTKRGEWIPVFKNDDRQEVRNYRPVTVLPAVDKIYEKLLTKQITEYMKPKLSHCLSAYRKNNGCESNILRLVENWKKNLDGKKVVGILSSDIIKAFDSLCPPLLIGSHQKITHASFSSIASN